MSLTRGGVELSSDGRPIGIAVRCVRTRRDDGSVTTAWHRTELLPYQAAEMERALGGYLRDLDAAYRDGKIKDFPIFPCNRLAGPTIPVSDDLQLVSEEGPSVLSIDPRISLLFDLTSEQRMGQGARCMRSHLELPNVQQDYAALRPTELGLLHIPAERKKPTFPVALSARQRRRIEFELTHGYLAELERAYNAALINDFPLFPEGRLVRGTARFKTNYRPLTRDAVRKQFHALELAAGIQPKKGRGWYGCKRRATDMADDVVSDERTKRLISGHRSASTRSIYEERLRRLDEAANARELARGNAERASLSATHLAS